MIQRFRFPGVSIAEVCERVSRFQQLLGEDIDLKVDQIGENIFHIRTWPKILLNLVGSILPAFRDTRNNQLRSNYVQNQLHLVRCTVDNEAVIKQVFASKGQRSFLLAQIWFQARIKGMLYPRLRPKEFNQDHIRTSQDQYRPSG